MINNNIITIVVPVYNVELYLREFLESLITQSYQNMEILLINDGSSDKSLSICEEYKKKDSRINVYNNTNHGVSYTRNFGIDKAKGDYILFTDSDDVLDKDYIEKMCNQISKNDIVICGYKEKYLNCITEHQITSKEETISKNEAIEKLFSNSSYKGFVWNKMFKIDTIKKNKLYFDENIKILEDMLFVYNYIMCFDTINVCLIPDCLYNYRMRKSSAINKASSSKENSVIQSLDIMYNDMNTRKLESINFYKLLVTSLNNLKNINLKNNFIKKNNVDVKDLYNKIIKDKSISLKEKLKFITKTKMNFIFELYMKKKRAEKKYYE